MKKGIGAVLIFCSEFSHSAETTMFTIHSMLTKLQMICVRPGSIVEGGIIHNLQLNTEYRLWKSALKVCQSWQL